MFKVSLLHRSAIFLFPFFFSVFAFSQASNPLTTEFLEGLPPDVREELQLNNVTTFCSRVEKLNLKVDFMVTRAVAKMPKIIAWSKNGFNQKSNHSIRNGIIALKGGNISNELSSLENLTILPIKELIDNEYFIDKKIVYFPVKLTNS